MTDITQIQKTEYNAIMRQVVAVIDRTGVIVSIAISSAIGTAHCGIRKLPHDRKVESKHGSGLVNQ